LPCAAEKRVFKRGLSFHWPGLSEVSLFGGGFRLAPEATRSPPPPPLPLPVVAFSGLAAVMSFAGS
jgi:hypothetical protein